MTGISRAPESSINQSMVYESAKQRADYAKINQQAVTGLKGPTYSDMAEVAHASMGVESLVTRIESNRSHFFNLQEKGQGVVAVIQGTSEIMSEFRTRLTGRMNGTAEPDNGFQQFCQDSLEKLTVLLNKEVEGASIMAGQKTDGPAVVDLSTLPPPQLGDPLSKIYYQGSDKLLSFDVGYDKKESLTLGVTAEDDAIAHAVRALLIGAHTEPNYALNSDNSLLLSRALDDSTKSINELGVLRQKSGTFLKTVEDQIEKQGDIKNSLISELKELKGVDLSKAWSDLLQRMSALELNQVSQVRYSQSIQQLIQNYKF